MYILHFSNKYSGPPTFLQFLAWNVPIILMIDLPDAEVVTTRNAKGKSSQMLLDCYELYRAAFSVFMALSG